VEQRVLAIVVEQLGLRETPKLTDRLIEDLGMDSLDCVELIMAVEEEFEVEIPDDEACKMVTAAAIVAYLNAAATRVQE